MNKVASSMISALLALSADSFAVSRVYYQNFDDTAKVEDFWLERNQSAKRIVGAADGAKVFKGNCLRGNWFTDYSDPITHLKTRGDEDSRYTLYDLYLDGLGISDSVYVDYWAMVDSNVHEDNGLKWVWLQGHHGTTWTWNYIIQPPWEGWDKWWIHSNNDESDDGGYGRDTLLSKLDGIKARMKESGDTDITRWFQGRWHHFQFYIKQNMPASARNGVLRFWIDDALVLNFSDFHWKQNDQDSIYFFSTPHMYGGGAAPPSSFGWQIDEMQVWNGLPSTTAIHPETNPVAASTFRATDLFDRNGRRISSPSRTGIYFAVGDEGGARRTKTLIVRGNPTTEP